MATSNFPPPQLEGPLEFTSWRVSPEVRLKGTVLQQLYFRYKTLGGVICDTHYEWRDAPVVPADADNHHYER